MVYDRSMSIASLRTGTCPGCGGTEVYTTRGLPKRGERMTVAVSSFSQIYLDTYLCLGCGHFEEHVPPEDLAKNAAKIRSTWTKV